MDCIKPTLWKVLQTLAFTVVFPLVVHAAQRISLQHLPFADLQEMMSLSLSAHPPNHIIAPSGDLMLVGRHRDAQQIMHTRMQQRYAGFPVFGGYAIFHQQRGTVLASNGAIYRKLREDLGERPAWFLSKMRTVFDQYCQQFPAEQITDKQMLPMVYIDDDGLAHWAYQLSVFLQPATGAPSRPTVIMAAKTRHVFLQWDDLHTLKQRVHGLGYGGNRRSGKHQFGKELPFLDLIRDDMTGQCFLENNHVMVVDMAHHTQRPNDPMQFDCEDDEPTNTYWTGYTGNGYDAINGGYSASNDAMHVGELVQKMFRQHYGLDVLRIGYQPMQLILRVHYSTHFANAFWDGRQMTFGDGDNAFYPLVSLGIAAHEISHGFTQQHSGLIYDGQAGGINEAFSDMAAQAAEFFIEGKSSWQIGADIMKGRGALRFLKIPSRDGVSIDRADDYRRDMDVHHSSGVYNRLFYVLAHRRGWDPGKAFHVMLKANMDYWTPTTTFEQGACGILAASRDLGFAVGDVKYALDKVMIDYGDC
ncbi:MAG: M4 family metallopeptidase [Gammaproteobacteria bacterium]|nr:M4 family metallopeptidase [Gammaproteobacteria bacterium]